MSTHVILKVIPSTDPGVQRMVKVKSGPSVRCACEPWPCGVCFSYASRDNTYRKISKTCSDHSCLIPKDSL